MNVDKAICWISTEASRHSVENAKLRTTENGYYLEGYISGFYEEPYVLKYKWYTDAKWQLQRTEINDLLNKRNLNLWRKNDNWLDGNTVISDVAGCLDIDISVTPSTNTLPINRITHSINDPNPINVIYFDYLKWQIRSVRQSYTLLDKNTFEYKNLDGGYIAELVTDSDGFVNNYPGLFQKINLRQ